MKKILALTLALIMCLSLVACAPTKPEEPTPPEPIDEPVTPGVDAPPAVERPEPVNMENRLADIEEAYSKNKDVVGWLYIPGLDEINSPVVQDTEGYSYEKRTATGDYCTSFDYWINGAYFTHKKNTFGDRTRLSRNTVIFGHSDLGVTRNNKKADDPTGPLFSQLYNFTDAEFAEKTPYIYFSTADEDMVFEIFSVMYNDSGAWYIQPRPDMRDYDTFLSTARDRSLYDYDVEVTTDDKVLTLSTCTVKFGWNDRDQYRFVIMAKLIEDEDATKEKAVFTVNPDPAEPNGAPYKS